MKKFAAFCLSFALMAVAAMPALAAQQAGATQHVHGYTTRSGRHVSGYTRHSGSHSGSHRSGSHRHRSAKRH